MFKRLFSRVLHLAFRFTRPMTLGVRGVLITPDKKILLVRHSYTSGWHLPGGGVEKNETIQTALHREVHQEAGLTILGSPALHGIFFNRGVSKRDHIAVFVCDAFEETGNKISWEITQSRFFPLDQLPEDIDPGTKRRIVEIFQNHPLSEDW